MVCLGSVWGQSVGECFVGGVLAAMNSAVNSTVNLLQQNSGQNSRQHFGGAFGYRFGCHFGGHCGCNFWMSFQMSFWRSFSMSFFEVIYGRHFGGHFRLLPCALVSCWRQDQKLKKYIKQKNKKFTANSQPRSPGPSNSTNKSSIIVVL